MTRKATRRRHYRLVNPITYAMEGAAITHTALMDRLRMGELSAIESFAKAVKASTAWQGCAPSGS